MYSVVEAGTMRDLSSQRFGSFAEWSDEDLLLEYRLTSRRELFEELVRRYEHSLFAYLRRSTGNAEDAEEIFQSTFLKVHARCEQFEEGRKFRPWLYRIATNIAIDRARLGQRRLKYNVESDYESNDENDIGVLQHTVGCEPLPFDNADTKEQMERLHHAIADLPENLRDVLNLVYFQGLSYRDAAEILGVPFGTIKTRLSSAYSKLHSTLR